MSIKEVATIMTLQEFSNIDCMFTDEIVCPHCGYEFNDSWEYDDFDDEMYCENCKKEFSYERKVEVTYTSYKNVD